MQFDPTNKIVKLCIQGMEWEGLGKPNKACKIFLQAWEEAVHDFEKFTAAHYVARHQKTVKEKLAWDKKALKFALKIKDQPVLASFPSLYLNIAKGYEDLKDWANAKENYESALSYCSHLAADGYGNLIKSGIKEGIKRIQNRQEATEDKPLKK